MLFTEDHLETDPEVSAGIEHGTLRIASMRADHPVTYPPCIFYQSSSFMAYSINVFILKSFVLPERQKLNVVRVELPKVANK